MYNNVAGPPWAQPSPQQTPADQQQQQPQAGPYAALYGRRQQPSTASQVAPDEQPPGLPAAGHMQQASWGQHWEADLWHVGHAPQPEAQTQQAVWSDGGQAWQQQVCALLGANGQWSLSNLKDEDDATLVDSRCHERSGAFPQRCG